MDETNQVQNSVKPDLPNATATLVLGIISIVSLCCCQLVGLVLGIIGLVMGNKAVELYRQSPGVYSESSYKNANAGKICSIIGLAIAALSVLLTLIFWSAYWAFIKTFLESYGYSF